MKLPVRCSAHARGLRLKAKAGFTLVEVMVAVGVMGIMFVSLYAGFAFGFTQIQLVRENDRATQILEEKMEVARLYNWDQVNDSSYIPTSFTAPFYANNPTNPLSGSFNYTGTVTVTNVTSPQFLAQPVTEKYADNLRLIHIQVSWRSGNVIRTRQMTTFVSRYGLQNYVY
jgi:prepilin-type N-terminal cleavage/methylation domain-containing protein